MLNSHGTGVQGVYMLSDGRTVTLAGGAGCSGVSFDWRDASALSQ